MDKPWLIRTYAGHSSAKKSNELYLKNLSKGQTGISVAFDLPTQTGYDSDHILAKGEVGKVGVPICHIGDMRSLFNQIPLDKMNTSMTINATAAWLLSLYVAVADEQGIDRNKLRGTTQNDVLKEYLSRGTYILPPDPSLKIISDVITFTFKEMPNCKRLPVNIIKLFPFISFDLFFIFFSIVSISFLILCGFSIYVIRLSAEGFLSKPFFPSTYV